jgi:transposase InsO family protein
MWRLSLICFPGKWWAGLSPTTCGQHCASVRYKWPFGAESRLGLLHHSDRGSQYASNEHRKHLSIMKMGQSMGRKGTNWDNSPTERFFRSLEHEQLTPKIQD